MTPQEFKAWFDGFTEALTAVPTKAQWARIKGRVAEIDGKAVTERVFVDRYWPTNPPSYWPYYRHYSAGSLGQITTNNAAGAGVFNQSGAQGQSQSALASYAASVGRNFNSANAMVDLGRADAAALARA